MPDPELAAIAASISRYPTGPAQNHGYKRTDYGNAERLVGRHSHVRRIPERERDPEIKLRLKRDPQVQSAIFAWAVEGCRAWQERGLVVPERVRRYTEEYRAENDPLADFFEERCVFEPRAVVRRSELRRAYEEWARENGEWPVAPRTLAGALKARGGSDGVKVDGERAWRGVSLRSWGQVDSPTESDSPS